MANASQSKVGMHQTGVVLLNRVLFSILPGAVSTTRYSAKGDCSVELMKTGMSKDVNKRCVEFDQELAKRISDGDLVLELDADVFFFQTLLGISNTGTGQGFGMACSTSNFG